MTLSATTRWVGALLMASVTACTPKAKVAAPPEAHGPSKADRMAEALREKEKEPEEKPKGPVYAAPFTAEQIRGATKEGRTYRYKVETPDKPTTEYAITFRSVDDLGTELQTGGDQAKRMSWKALQQNSEFPRDKVVTRPDKVKIPAGKFDCIVYEVTADDGEVWTYYFAKKLPGAPVFFYVERDGERLRTTTLVQHLPGSSARASH